MLLCVSTMLHTVSLSPICITIGNTRIPVEFIKYVGVTRYTILRYIFIDYLPWIMCWLNSYSNANAILHRNIIWRIRLYTFTFESRSQHHTKRTLKPLGTIALLSSITCRLSEISVSGSFKLMLPPPFSMVILWSSIREQEGKKKIDLLHLSKESFRTKKTYNI